MIGCHARLGAPSQGGGAGLTLCLVSTHSGRRPTAHEPCVIDWAWLRSSVLGLVFSQPNPASRPPASIVSTDSLSRPPHSRRSGCVQHDCVLTSNPIAFLFLFLISCPGPITLPLYFCYLFVSFSEEFPGVGSRALLQLQLSGAVSCPVPCPRRTRDTPWLRRPRSLLPPPHCRLAFVDSVAAWRVE